MSGVGPCDDTLGVNKESNDYPRMGPVLAPGLGHRLDDVAQLPPLRPHLTGFEVLDGWCRLFPGSVWGVSAEHASGLSTLACQLAAALCQTARVLIVNGHMPTTLVCDRILSACERAGVCERARQRIDLGSGIRFPDDWDLIYSNKWFGGMYDAIIVDTLDEMYPIAGWPDTDEGLVQFGRRLREVARYRGISLIFMARLPFRGDSELASQAHHWSDRLFPDVGDVYLRFDKVKTPHCSAHDSVFVYSRGVEAYRVVSVHRPPEHWIELAWPTT